MRILERVDKGIPFPDGEVNKNGDEMTALHMGMFLIRVNNLGRVEINWGWGKIGKYQDERFKQLYAHLEKIYEIFHEGKTTTEPAERYPIEVIKPWEVCKHEG